MSRSRWVGIVPWPEYKNQRSRTVGSRSVRSGQEHLGRVYTESVNDRLGQEMVKTNSHSISCRDVVH